MAALKVPFSERDFKEVERLVNEAHFEGLRPLYTKMIKAKEPKVVYDFTDAQARIIANEILGNSVYFGEPIASQTLMINRYFRKYNIEQDSFSKACRVAKATWKKPMMYETMALNSYKLKSQPEFSSGDNNVLG